ncbi:MAG: hypothetical protein M3285_05405 [Actinomycetota bacterium]|nr:hypothetical protein [Actinomycetota bacterium]
MSGQLKRTTGATRFHMLFILGAAVTLLVVLASQVPGEARGQVTARLPKCDGVEATIVGTAGNDVLEGTQGPDVIVAQGGHDKIFGNGGDDLICAGGGHDWLEGGGGDDVLLGGSQSDALGAPPEDAGGIPHEFDDPNGFPAGVTVIGDVGDEIMRGGPGNDLLRGGPGDDMLFGEEDNDELGCCYSHGKYIGDIGFDGFDGGDDVMDGGEGDDMCTDWAGDNTQDAFWVTCEIGFASTFDDEPPG